MSFKNLPLLLLFLTNITVFAQSTGAVKPAIQELFSEFENLRDFSMSTAGGEVYFTAQSPMEEVSVLVQAKKGETAWEKRLFLPHSGQYKDLEPFLSPDGLKLYFASNRPLKNSSEAKKDFDIWVLERKNIEDNWSDPINMGAPVNSEFNEFYPSVSNNNNIYFTSDRPNGKGKDDIYVSKWDSNLYSDPVSMGASINSEGYEFNSFVSPNEDYLLFSGYNREDGMGSGDLYMSIKIADGSWGEAKNLGSKINSDKMDYCPFIDFQSGTLYFTSKRSDIKATKLNNLEEFEALMKTTSNGHSKIYQVPFNPVQLKD